MMKLQTQKGSVLLLALVILVVFIVASAGMIKSSLVSVGSATSYAYREGASVIADSVITTIKAKIFGGTDKTTSTTYTAIDLTSNKANLYSAVLLDDTRISGGSGDGVPANPCGGSTGWTCVPVDSSTYPNYSVQYFVERMCNKTGTISDSAASCQVVKPTVANGGSQSNRGGNQQTVSFNTYPILYRATIKVTGPANVSTTTQVYFSN